MRIFILLLLVPLTMGCWSTYEFKSDSVKLINYGIPAVKDAETGLTRAATLEEIAAAGFTISGEGNQTNSLNIGGDSSNVADIVASFEATVRDLITGTPAP